MNMVEEKLKRLEEIAIKLDQSETDLKEFQQKWNVGKPLPSMALEQMKRLVSKHNKLVKAHNRLCPEHQAQFI